MAERRKEITLSTAEIDDFLAPARIVNVATNGGDGWPHLTALWYVVREGDLWIWTYAKSQKVRNLERDPRATLLVEDGLAYNELRGVMMRTNGVIHSDSGLVLEIGEEIFKRYAQPDPTKAVSNEARDGLIAQSAKRVAVEFKTTSTVSWDHRKLA